MVAVLVAAFIVVRAPQAKAEPPDGSNRSVVSWDITNLGNPYYRASTSNQYYGMVTQIRNLVGHTVRRANGDQEVSEVQETTDRDHIVEVQVRNNGNHFMSIYMWARTLYVWGFWTRSGGHRVFNDATLYGNGPAMLGIAVPERLPWTGNYAQMPGGSQQERANFGYTGVTLYNALLNVGDMVHQIDTGHQTNVGRNIVRVVGAVAEAVRFRTIRNTVGQGIQQDIAGYLSQDQIAYENSWNRISQWIYGALHGYAQNSLVINSQTYTTIAALLGAFGAIEYKNQRR